MWRRVAAGQQDKGRVSCTVCQRQLPKSAFSKAELSKSGSGRCRNCIASVRCQGCSTYFPPASLDSARRCQRCRENAQVDKLLQTPKDEVTHFGAWQALCLQREVEHTLLLVCHRHGVWERCVLQKVLDFLRVPFITSHSGMQYCELCDEAFGETSITQGQQLHMASPSATADWFGCPGPALKFNAGETHLVAELHKASNGNWFFRTLAKKRPKKPPKNWREITVGTMIAEVEDTVRERVSTFLECHELDTCGALAMVSQQYLVQILARSEDDMDVECQAVVQGLVRQAQSWASSALSNGSAPEFISLWAPVSATVEGRRPSPLVEHLASKQHTAFEQEVSCGNSALVSRTALELAKALSESPTTSLSRLRVGLGIVGRFCAPGDALRAQKLQRVRDSTIPVKFFRDVLPERKDFLWVTAKEMDDVEDAYAQRKSGKGSRKES